MVARRSGHRVTNMCMTDYRELVKENNCIARLYEANIMERVMLQQEKPITINRSLHTSIVAMGLVKEVNKRHSIKKKKK